MVFAAGIGSEALISPLHVLIILAAYLLVVWPSGPLIGRIIQRWKRTPPSAAPEQRKSLDKAGRWIGYLERILILTFVLLQEYTAIGFLVTAKSIFRFEATRQEGEYILLGTLLSFSVAILAGVLVNAVLSLIP
ncbi:MAG: hypothetical protein QMD46_09705 [Methanomicrobiales archaeon]|nr:hypothetical protein [Methanomicrobiales archaeon]MDI6877365.1 hypothetical protein [Methanomicrobiales archaeon]